MQLIGMLDSPYVRRVAISLQLLGLPFTHRSISVFRMIDEFKKYNPVVKAPTLVCDDGTVLMDSPLILDYAEAVAGRSLLPSDLATRQHCLRVIGLALAACEKSIQIYYEQNLRPGEKQHQPWIARVTGQMMTAYGALETEVSRKPLPIDSETMNQASVTAAVSWQFTQLTHPGLVPASDFPALSAFSAKAEALPEFARAPHGEGVYPARV